MRVLAHIHTYNAADVIDGTIEAVLKQTRAVDQLIVVDSASTDDTLEQPLVRHAKVLRLPENLGVSGAVRRGLSYGLEAGFDWIWILDADSAPNPDALEKLLDLFTEWPQEQQERIGFVACVAVNASDNQPIYGQVFTERGIDLARPGPEQRHYRCDATIWSGCLYRLAAIRQVGLPNPNYVLDAGDCAYGYQVMKAGFQGFICQDAVLRHNVHGRPSFLPVRRKVGPLTLHFFELPPIRCYYGCRNTLYFALYDRKEGRLRQFVRTAFGLSRLTANFLLRPRRHGQEIAACLRGLWHGVTGNIAARY